MDLKQLNYFISAAKHENFTRAAQECFIVQTAMTHQIAALEKELGVSLFERSSRRVKLTPAGEVFLGQAQRIVQAAEDAAALVRAAAENAKRVLRIGYCGRLLRKELPEILSEYARSFPQVKPLLSGGNLAQMLERLQAGVVDCVITLEYSHLGALNWLACERLCTDRLMVAMRRDHPLAERKKLTAADLVGQPYILYRERGVMEKMALHANNGEALNIVAQTEDAESTEIMAEAGLGITFALEHVCDRSNPRMVYVPYEGEGQEGALALCWNRSYPREDVEQFLALAKKYIAQEHPLS